MIIWVASYPKSGNTWVRSIISSLIYTKDGIFDFPSIKKIMVKITDPKITIIPDILVVLSSNPYPRSMNKCLISLRI